MYLTLDGVGAGRELVGTIYWHWKYKFCQETYRSCYLFSSVPVVAITPADTRRWPHARLMLDHSLWHWPTFNQHKARLRPLVSAGTVKTDSLTPANFKLIVPFSQLIISSFPYCWITRPSVIIIIYILHLHGRPHPAPLRDHIVAFLAVYTR